MPSHCGRGAAPNRGLREDSIMLASLQLLIARSSGKKEKGSEAALFFCTRARAYLSPADIPARLLPIFHALVLARWSLVLSRLPLPCHLPPLLRSISAPAFSRAPLPPPRSAAQFHAPPSYFTTRIASRAYSISPALGVPAIHPHALIAGVTSPTHLAHHGQGN